MGLYLLYLPYNTKKLVESEQNLRELVKTEKWIDVTIALTGKGDTIRVSKISDVEEA